jgi:hypothetical protein
MKKSEIILVGIIIIGAIFSFAGLKFFQSLHKSNHVIAVVRQNNQVIERIDLDAVTESRKLTIAGDYQNIIYVEKGRIRFEEADCPDKICVQTGWLTKYGDIAVCIPNKAVITIEKD